MPAGSYWAIGFLVVVGGLVAAGMIFAWKRRSFVGRKYELGDSVGDIVASFMDVHFVAVTPVGDPLVRVNLPGLIYRGRADVAVHSEGVTVRVAGEDRKTVPASAITKVSAETTRIDRTVEKGGLAVVTWEYEHAEQGVKTPLELVLRFPETSDHQRFVDAVHQITVHNAPQHPENNPEI